MRLSRREQAMKRFSLDRLMMLAIFAGMPCTALAQEDGTMSFSEDEVDEAEQGGEMPFGEDDSESSETEDSEGDTVSDADVLSALGETSIETSETSEAVVGAVEEEKEQHPIWAVQRIYALHRGRVDLQPSFGISMNDPYVQHQAVNLGLSYYITEVLGIGVNFNFYRWMNAPTPLNFRLSRSTHQVAPINEYFWGGQLNFTYVPMYGKFAFFEEWILHWDVWVIGGGGFIFTRPIPTIDPDVRSFDFSMKFCFNIGIGGRLFLNRFLALYLELRDYIFPEELESLNTYSDEARRYDKKQWLDEDLKLTNNVMLHVGVSLFIPFAFEYKLPK